MHDLMGNVDMPLAQIPYEDLTPGSAELPKILGKFK